MAAKKDIKYQLVPLGDSHAKFAGFAMQGLLGHRVNAGRLSEGEIRLLVEDAWKLADVMLAFGEDRSHD